jgi:Ca2+/H+ antiporter
MDNKKEDKHAELFEHAIATFLFLTIIALVPGVAEFLAGILNRISVADPLAAMIGIVIGCSLFVLIVCSYWKIIEKIGRNKRK